PDYNRGKPIVTGFLTTQNEAEKAVLRPGEHLSWLTCKATTTINLTDRVVSSRNYLDNATLCVTFLQ
ncbi:unnamed protein product, partial [marine sediment metagenome]